MEETTLYGTPEVREAIVQLAICQLELNRGLVGLEPLNTLLMALAAECNLQPPAEPIQMTVGNNGQLIFRCAHTPCHEWDMAGKRL